jgi:hypothetical protein
VYDAWNAKRYGLRAGSADSKTLREIYERTYVQARLMYFTLGFWTPKDQTMIPDSVRSIEGSIRGKSSALWDPSQKDLEDRLVHPTPATYSLIMRDRSEAVELAERNLMSFRQIEDRLKPRDAADWETRLSISVAVAKVWRTMADAIWSLRVAEEKADASQETAKMLKQKAAAMVTDTKMLQGDGPGASLRFDMVDSARALAADIGKRMDAVSARNGTR